MARSKQDRPQDKPRDPINKPWIGDVFLARKPPIRRSKGNWVKGPVFVVYVLSMPEPENGHRRRVIVLAPMQYVVHEFTEKEWTQWCKNWTGELTVLYATPKKEE